jgi:hypothetical protein
MAPEETVAQVGAVGVVEHGFHEMQRDLNLFLLLQTGSRLKVRSGSASFRWLQELNLMVSNFSEICQMDNGGIQVDNGWC